MIGALSTVLVLACIVFWGALFLKGSRAAIIIAICLAGFVAILTSVGIGIGELWPILSSSSLGTLGETWEALTA